MKRENVILIIGLFLAIVGGLIALILDADISLFFESIRGRYLDYFFVSIGFTANVVLVVFFLMALFLWKAEKRRYAITVVLTSVFSFLVSYLIKILIQRPRPFQNDTLLSAGFKTFTLAFYFIEKSFKTWNFSFPSFEALFIFSMLPILNKNFRKFKPFWIIFACIVSLSRVYFGVHFLSDTIFGAVIGYCIGLLMVYIEERTKIGLRIIKLFERK